MTTRPLSEKTTVWVTCIKRRRWIEISRNGQSVRLRNAEDGHEVTVPSVELERNARREDRE